MVKKRQGFIISILFIIFIVSFFIMNILISSKRFSQMENRNLAQMPEFNLEDLLSGEFSEDFESYITDQFLGRDFFIKMKSTSEVLLGKQENGEIYLGDKQTLLEDISPIEERLLTENIDAINRLQEQLKVPVYFALIPTSVSIWEERLPKGAPSLNQETLINEIYNQIKEETVDIYGRLSDHSEEEIYYRTDHHWTSLGAYYGYATFIEQIGEVPMEIHDFQKETVTKDFYGSLYSKVGAWWIEPDNIDVYVPEDTILITKTEGSKEVQSTMYHEKYLDKKDKYSYFMGGNQPLVKVENTELKEHPKLLIIRDSYMDSQLPFLTQHYSEIHLVDFRFYKGDIVEYAKVHEIDMMLISYGLENFVGDRNLKFI